MDVPLAVFLGRHGLTADWTSDMSLDADPAQATGYATIVIPGHISDKAQGENLIAETQKQLGPVDILVCNAASNPYYGPNEKLPDEVFMKVMQNNILSNMWLVNLCLPDMRAKKDGSIMIVSSIGGVRASTVIGAYCISKAADMQLARNLAAEYGPDNIRVNTIAPGLITTDFARALYENPERRAAREAATPLRRLGALQQHRGGRHLACRCAGLPCPVFLERAACLRLAAGCRRHRQAGSLPPRSPRASAPAFFDNFYN